MAESDFSIRTINGLVTRFAAEAVPDNTLQTLFETRGRRVAPDRGGEEVSWDEVTHSRHLAPMTGRDSPFPIATDPTIAKRTIVIADIKVMKRIPGSRLFYQRGLGKLTPDSRQWVDLQIRDALKIVRNTKEYLASGALFGSTVVSPVTVPGSKVTFTLTQATNAYVAANPWSDPATDIVTVEVPALKADFEQTCGRAPAQAIITPEISTSIRKNDELLNLLDEKTKHEFARTTGRQVGPAHGSFDLGELRWDVNGSGYMPEGGAFTRYMATLDKGVLLPADLSDVLGYSKARGMVPDGPEIASLEQAERLVQEAPQEGAYGYAARAGNPKTDIELYIGERVIYFLIEPTSVCVFDTIPGN